MKEGYPENTELNIIENYNIHEVFDLIEYIKIIWTYDNFLVEKWIKYNNYHCIQLELNTGGWSGNEDIVKALLKNNMFKNLWYHSWKRGGHYVFIINPYNIEFKLVSEHCSHYNISRQAIHKSKDKYDWLIVSRNVNLIRIK